MKKVIGVIGGSSADSDIWNDAYEIGRIIGSLGYPLICGGGSGVMEAVSKGASETGCTVVGIMPGGRDGANDYLEFAISTNMGMARNAIIVESSDVIVAIDGEYGTLSELAFAMQKRKPVISYKCRYSSVLGIKEASDYEDVAKFVRENIN